MEEIIKILEDLKVEARLLKIFAQREDYDLPQELHVLPSIIQEELDKLNGIQ